MHVYKTHVAPRFGLANSRDNHSDHKHPRYYNKSADQELQYWRSHPNLHRWFEKLYYEHGGTEEELNDPEESDLDEDYTGWFSDEMNNYKKIPLKVVGYSYCEEVREYRPILSRRDEQEIKCEPIKLSFNRQSVEIKLADLDALEACIKDNLLPKEGATIGSVQASSRGEGRDKEDLEFIKKAKEALKKGYFLYYISSW